MLAKLGNCWRRHCDGGGQQHVYVVECLLYVVAALLEVAAGAKSIVCGDVSAGLDARESAGLVKVRRVLDKGLVIGVGFGARQGAVGGNFEFDVANLRLQSNEYFDCLVDGGGDIGMQIVEEKFPWHS